jgi:uncharacterized coiled-coil protein SlyX
MTEIKRRQSMKIHILPHNKTGIMFSLFIILVFSFWWMPARADIYFWTDSEGVIHFSNYAAPPEAQFYMVEYSPQENDQAESKTAAIEHKRDPLKDQLAEANRKLEKALDKVDDLTEQVEQTRREALEAADAARRAEAEAKADDESRTAGSLVYAVPYGHKRRKPYPEPYYWKHDTSKYPYYQDNRHRSPHRPEGKPEHVAPRTSGISVGFSRNGTRIQGAVGLDSLAP